MRMEVRPEGSTPLGEAAETAGFHGAVKLRVEAQRGRDLI
tara:strand:- start:187 stop:306 length:120 start_codon:yes stop_codon:yes gene_type:complete